MTTLPAGWKPIESAPKDGTEIIVFHPDAGVCAAFCPADGFAWHCMDGMNTVVGKKSGQSIPVMTSFLNPPLYWMPLPAAPGTPPAAPTLSSLRGFAPEACDGMRSEDYVNKARNGGWLSPDCAPPASAQDDAKDERTRVMEVIAGVWDRAAQIDDAADEVIDLLRAPAAGDARDQAEMLRLERDHERAKNERLLAILVGITHLTLPSPITVGDKQYVFTPPEAVAQLRNLSDRIRAIPAEIDAALSASQQQEW